jgi:hypothetical protein
MTTWTDEKVQTKIEKEASKATKAERARIKAAIKAVKDEYAGLEDKTERKLVKEVFTEIGKGV